ncbi:MAG: YqjK-like family protein [Gallionella sp.]|nr:YqjK-like family protein [Gallionella sp.]
MNERLFVLRQCRGELLAKIATQREQVAQLGVRWEAPLAVADKGVAVFRFLHSRPILVVGAVALLAWRGRGVAGLARAGWLAWKSYRSLVRLAAAKAGVTLP